MRFRHLAVTAVSVALVTVPLAALASDGDAEAKSLSDRHVERYEVSMTGASIKAGGAKVLVDAPIARVRKTVQDYGKYATFMPRFKKSRVIAKKDGKTDVYLELPILNGAATVWSQIRFEPPAKEGKDGDKGERIDGKMIDGNVDDMRTVFHLRAVDDTHTLLKCEILVVPKLPLPGSVVTPELQYAADSAAKSLRERSEQKTTSDGTAKR